jgi:osmotically-inducible protein OsmY
MPPHVTTGYEGDTPVSERAKAALRGASAALRRVSCEFHDGLLTLSGQLPTYYLKQVAQESVSRLEGVRRVVNRIEVVSALPE